MNVMQNGVNAMKSPEPTVRKRKQKMEKNADGTFYTLLESKFSDFCEGQFQVDLSPSGQERVHPILADNIRKAMHYAYELGVENGKLRGYRKGLSKFLCSWCEEWKDKKEQNSKGLCRRCACHDI